MTISYVIGAVVGVGYIIYVIVELLLKARASEITKSKVTSTALYGRPMEPVVGDEQSVSIGPGEKGVSAWIELPNMIPVRVYGVKVEAPTIQPVTIGSAFKPGIPYTIPIIEPKEILDVYHDYEELPISDTGAKQKERWQ